MWTRLAFVLMFAPFGACSSLPEENVGVQRGEDLARVHCSACHAVGRFGESPSPEAPPFRDLSRSYRVANLEEALAEGISVGHPAMPQFEFPPDDADALIAYLESIQTSDTR